jgi:hypothetical protein
LNVSRSTELIEFRGGYADVGGGLNPAEADRLAWQQAATIARLHRCLRRFSLLRFLASRNLSPMLMGGSLDALVAGWKRLGVTVVGQHRAIWTNTGHAQAGFEGRVNGALQTGLREREAGGHRSAAMILPSPEAIAGFCAVASSSRIMGALRKEVAQVGQFQTFHRRAKALFASPRDHAILLPLGEEAMVNARFTFSAVGSTGEIYTINAGVNAGGRPWVTCTCQAAQNGTHCKHRIALLSGDVERFEPAAVDDITAFRKMIEGTDLAHCVETIVAQTAAFDRAKADLTKTKARLNRLLLG